MFVRLHQRISATLVGMDVSHVVATASFMACVFWMSLEGAKVPFGSLC